MNLQCQGWSLGWKNLKRWNGNFWVDASEEVGSAECPEPIEPAEGAHPSSIRARISPPLEDAIEDAKQSNKCSPQVLLPPSLLIARIINELSHRKTRLELY